MQQVTDGAVTAANEAEARAEAIAKNGAAVADVLQLRKPQPPAPQREVAT